MFSPLEREVFQNQNVLIAIFKQGALIVLE